MIKILEKDSNSHLRKSQTYIENILMYLLFQI